MPANSLDKSACAGLRLTRGDHLDATAKLSPHRIVDAERPLLQNAAPIGAQRALRELCQPASQRNRQMTQALVYF